jgi:Amt family ammonium transporter
VIAGSPEAVAIAVAAILLIPFALVGLALITVGMVRSRNAAHVMMSSLCVIGIAAVAYFVCGFSWQGVTGAPGFAFRIGGRQWDWIGNLPFFWRGLDWTGSPAALVVLMQMLSAALAAMIPLGSAGERWRLGAICASTAVMAGLIYPVFAHWVWAGGWLAALGANYGLGQGFVDAGGSSTIQAVGGLTALVMVWLLGPRRGKYTSEGIPTAIPGHNAVLVLFGCLLAWIGWTGLNSAGAILFSGVDPRQFPLIAVNTTLGAGSSALAAAVVTLVRFGKPDASLSANGWVAGLAAGSGACAFVPPASAVLIGLVAGGAVSAAIENLELRLGIDDPGGAISVHAVGGLWGVLAVGIFGRFPMPVMNTTSIAPQSGGQWLAQLIGIATLLGCVLPFAYGVNWLLHRLLPYRVAPDGERQGLDLHELGAGAYPDFMTHTDEFLQR